MPLGLQGCSAPLFLQAVRTCYTSPPTLPSPLAGSPPMLSGPRGPPGSLAPSQALALLGAAPRAPSAAQLLRE